VGVSIGQAVFFPAFLFVAYAIGAIAFKIVRPRCPGCGEPDLEPDVRRGLGIDHETGAKKLRCTSCEGEFRRIGLGQVFALDEWERMRARASLPAAKLVRRD
jgi:hypothetical protein